MVRIVDGTTPGERNMLRGEHPSLSVRPEESVAQMYQGRLQSSR